MRLMSHLAKKEGMDKVSIPKEIKKLYKVRA